MDSLFSKHSGRIALEANIIAFDALSNSSISSPSRYNPEISQSSKQSMPDFEAIKLKIETLRLEHRDLDDVIMRLSDEKAIDQLQIRRLKKRKLLLKDQIAKLESKLIPDLNA